MRELRRRWPLVGREVVLGRARAALSSGEVDAVVLRGPSGVGKTRLMEEILIGAPVFPIRVAATHGSVDLPLEAIADLLSRADGAADSTVSGAALVARARRGVRALATGRGTPLLAVDDVSRLDPLSVTVLAALVADGTARMVATARSDEPLPDVVLGWWRSGRAVRVDVAALDVEQVGVLLERVLDGPCAPGAVAALHQASGGLPLHLREITAGAVEAEELVETAGVWRLIDEHGGSLSATPALRELLLARIDARSTADRDLLDRLAVCSALRLGEIPGDERAVTAAVAALEEAGLVELVDPASPDPLIRPAHPQITASLRDRLPRLRARALLLEQAAVLEGGRDAGGDTAPAEGDTLRIAQWRLAATGTAERDVLLAAARRALTAHDHATAEHLALAAIAPAPSGSADPAAWLLLARARWESGRPQDAGATLDEAAAAGALALDDPDAAVLRAAALVDDPRLVEQALAALAPLRELVVTGARPDLAATVAELLLELDRVGDALAVVEESPTAGDPGAPGDGVDVLVGDLSAVAARVYSEAARGGDARRHVDRAVARARARSDVGRDGLLAAALGARCRTLTNEGRPVEAIEVGREAMVHAVGARVLPVIADIEYDLAFAHGVLAQPAASERWCRDIVSSASARRHLRHLERGLSAIAFNAAGMGDTDRMKWAFAALDELGVPEDESAGLVRARALERAVVHGDRRGAWALLTRRARLGEQRGGDLWAAIDWFEAVLSYGSPDTDPESVAHLVAIAARTDSRFVELMAAHATAAASRDLDGLVAVLDRWDAAGCVAIARRAAVTAVAIARATGQNRRAAALERRFDDLARRSPDAVFPRLDAPTLTPLTRREREVAELAAGGASSADIAARLVLSVRTVNNHLGSAYTKLGVTGRHELAAALKS